LPFESRSLSDNFQTQHLPENLVIPHFSCRQSDNISQYCPEDCQVCGIFPYQNEQTTTDFAQG
jgi:hypothetical protein